MPCLQWELVIIFFFSTDLLICFALKNSFTPFLCLFLNYKYAFVSITCAHTASGVKSVSMSSVCSQTEALWKGPCVAVQGHCVHLQVRFFQLRLAHCTLLTLSAGGHSVHRSAWAAVPWHCCTWCGTELPEAQHRLSWNTILYVF